MLITGDGSRTLTSDRYGESYRSRLGALSEARHLFLEASGVGDRLRRLEPTSVLEVGFGTGLNFLVTATAASASGAVLDYLALERELPPAAAVATLDYPSLLSPSPLPEQLQAWTSAAPFDLPGEFLFVPPRGGPNGQGAVRLRLLIGDALDYAPPVGSFHAIYLDPFSPRANPEPWSAAYLRRLADALAPGGRLVTFSVSGAVRRALGAAGLAVNKVPGPPSGKREVLVARQRAPAP